MNRALIDGVAATATAVIACALVVSTVRDSETREQPTLLVVGDSITKLSAPEFEQTFGSAFDVDIVARDRADSDEIETLAERHAPSEVDVLVINSGTNDALGGPYLEGEVVDDAIDNVEEIAREFIVLRCIVVITVNENVVSFSRRRVDEQAANFNAALRTAASEHGWQTVEWSRLVQEYRDSGEPFGPLTSDLIHPTAAGRQLLVDAVSRAVEDCPETG